MFSLQKIPADAACQVGERVVHINGVPAAFQQDDGQG